jgi:hypothetical protein
VSRWRTPDWVLPVRGVGPVLRPRATVGGDVQGRTAEKHRGTGSGSQGCPTHQCLPSFRPSQIGALPKTEHRPGRRVAADLNCKDSSGLSAAARAPSCFERLIASRGSCAHVQGAMRESRRAGELALRRGGSPASIVLISFTVLGFCNLGVRRLGGFCVAGQERRFVPFVQQLFGKQHRRLCDPRFLIACACSFGNRDSAMEGGIPRSPHRGSDRPKGRDREPEGYGEQGDQDGTLPDET